MPSIINFPLTTIFIFKKFLYGMYQVQRAKRWIFMIPVFQFLKNDDLLAKNEYAFINVITL